MSLRMEEREREGEDREGWRRIARDNEKNERTAVPLLFAVERGQFRFLFLGAMIFPFARTNTHRERHHPRGNRVLDKQTRDHQRDEGTNVSPSKQASKQAE